MRKLNFTHKNINSTKKVTPFARFFKARLKPFTRPMFWAPPSIAALLGICIWQYVRNPDLLNAASDQPETVINYTEKSSEVSANESENYSLDDLAAGADIDNLQTLLTTLNRSENTKKSRRKKAKNNQTSSSLPSEKETQIKTAKDFFGSSIEDLIERANPKDPNSVFKQEETQSFLSNSSVKPIEVLKNNNSSVNRENHLQTSIDELLPVNSGLNSNPSTTATSNNRNIVTENNNINNLLSNQLVFSNNNPYYRSNNPQGVNQYNQQLLLNNNPLANSQNGIRSNNQSFNQFNSSIFPTNTGLTNNTNILQSNPTQQNQFNQSVFANPTLRQNQLVQPGLRNSLIQNQLDPATLQNQWTQSQYTNSNQVWQQNDAIRSYYNSSPFQSSPFQQNQTRVLY